MSKKNREKRIAHAEQKAAVQSHRPTRAAAVRVKWQVVAGAAVVALIAGSFVIPGLVKDETPKTTATPMAMNAGPGTGLRTGTAVPSFRESDVETGKALSSGALYNRKTLLFFSEGVMCQACFEQIQGLQQFGAQLHRRGIELVSITPDSPDELRQAISQYGITTPVISDADRTMSSAFNTLGKGMHGDTPGHAFALIYHGKIVWYHDYWLPPEGLMYVEPAKLLHDIPRV